jgi:hypothetical protein
MGGDVGQPRAYQSEYDEDQRRQEDAQSVNSGGMRRNIPGDNPGDQPEVQHGWIAPDFQAAPLK